MPILALVLSSVGVPIAKWLLTKGGAWLSVNVKTWVAKFMLWTKEAKAKSDDHNEMKTIREKIEKSQTHDEIDSALSDLLKHF